MIKRHFPFWFLVLVFVGMSFYSCKKDKGDPVVIIVTPSAVNITANANSSIMFKVEVTSDHPLSRLVIKSRFELAQPQVELDSSLSGTSATIYFLFHVPDTTAGTSVFAEFSAYDSDGNQSETGRRIIIQNESSFLTETTGHIMFSTYSGKTDGFDLSSLSPVFQILSPDSLLHLADYDTIPDSTLMNRWYSPAGNKFVLFNGFDYANATKETAKAAYDAGMKVDMLSGIQPNDLIITRVNASTPFYVVIKITAVLDPIESDNDRYEFNIKK